MEITGTIDFKEVRIIIIDRFIISMAVLFLAASCGQSTSESNQQQPQKIQTSASTQLFLHRSGNGNNPSGLYLDLDAPTRDKNQFLDSPKLGFKDGNPWRVIGQWDAPADSVQGLVSGDSDVSIWLGQKNGESSAVFDLRAELLRNGNDFASGEALAISGLEHGPNHATRIDIGAIGSTEVFDGESDIFSVRFLARLGSAGGSSQSKAQSIRLYFDASSSPSQCVLQEGDLPKEDWNMFGHDQAHSRLSPHIGPQTDNLLWTVTTGNKVLCSPAINPDGVIYFGSFDKKLYAINPDGSTAWTYTTGGQVDSGPAIRDDGSIVFGSGDTYLYCLDADATLLWQFKTQSYINASPVISATGTVYIGSADHSFYALDPDGSLAWSFLTGGPISSSAAIGPDGSIYVGSSDANIYAFNPDGSLQWSFSTGSSIFSSPSVGSDGTVYVGSNDGNLYAIDPDGSLKWSSGIALGFGVSSSPALDADGTIYVGTVNGVLVALNSDGSTKWTYPTGIQMYSSPSIDADGTVYVGSHDHHIYAVNNDGSLKWSYTTGERVFSSPAISSDGRIYIGSFDGKLYAFGS